MSQFNLDSFPIVWQVVKWLYVLGFAMYGVFALLAWRQIQLMTRTLNGVLELPLRLVGGGLTLLALVGLVMAVVVL